MPDLITVAFPKAEKTPVILGNIVVQLVLEKPTTDASHLPSYFPTSIISCWEESSKRWTGLNSNIACSATDIRTPTCGLRRERGDLY